MTPRPSFLILFLFTINYNYAKGEMDFIYSPSDLSRLVNTEQQLSRFLQEIGENLQRFTAEVEGYQKAGLETYSSEDIIKNPLLSYHLVKKHALDLETFDSHFETFSEKIKDLQSSYIKLRTTFTKPNYNDFEHAKEAIVRLRQTYNLSIDNLAEGRVGPLLIDGHLSPKDLADIGLYAKQSGMATNAKMFLDAALNRQAKTEDATNNASDGWIRNAQSNLTYLIENSNHGRKSDREDYRLLTEIDEYFATDSLDNLNSVFENLCQINAVKEAPLSKLKCYLDKRSHPMRQISPLKIEVYHEDPQIVVIYDFMSDSELKAIESATFHKLKRSLIQVFKEGGGLDAVPSIIRTTSQTWIYDFAHPQFGYLSKRIESVTGYFLSGINSAEELQVASYRPGGHYSLHTDGLREELLEEFFSDEDKMRGDRVATFMIYMSDVEIGGNTAFPALNVSVRPVKGSAILWGNLHPDGKIARNTLHGACPVIYGIKNIATKWIRANDQMFTRQKCKIDKSSDHFNL